jgi:VIT1/CCC1 family predicted Fe2+/Mn2+ transporter
MLSNLLLCVVLSFLMLGGVGFIYAAVEFARREREMIGSAALLVGAFACFGVAWSIANYLGL